jgi:hypothetical protein
MDCFPTLSAGGTADTSCRQCSIDGGAEEQLLCGSGGSVVGRGARPGNVKKASEPAAV